MVSSILCPAVHILGFQNVYNRAEGIADHYWPWAVFCALSQLKGLQSLVGGLGEQMETKSRTSFSGSLCLISFIKDEIPLI